MQNVVLGAYAYDITHSSTFVGVIIFAQLGPALLLAMVGGLIADKVDRKKFLIVLSVEQLVFSLALAWVVRTPSPSPRAARGHGGHGRGGQCHVRARPTRPSSPPW
jgi:MFS family permease